MITAHAFAASLACLGAGHEVTAPQEVRRQGQASTTKLEQVVAGK